MFIDDNTGQIYQDYNKKKYIPVTRSPHWPSKTTETMDPRHIVYHCSGRGDYRSIISQKERRDSSPPWHVLISRTGRLHQFISFHRPIEHILKQEWHSSEVNNNNSIAICLLNSGHDSPTNKPYDPHSEERVSLRHKNSKHYQSWQRFSPAQFHTLNTLYLVLRLHHGPLDQWGYDDLSPSTTWEPGPAFWELPVFAQHDETMHFSKQFNLLVGKQEDTDHDPAA